MVFKLEIVILIFVQERLSDEAVATIRPARRKMKYKSKQLKTAQHFGESLVFFNRRQLLGPPPDEGDLSEMLCLLKLFHFYIFF